MSKKHFIALAKQLNRTMPQVDNTADKSLSEGALYQWKRDVEAVVDVCSAMNPQFEYNTFRRACGVTS